MNLAHKVSSLRHQSERIDRTHRALIQGLRRGAAKLRAVWIVAVVGGVGGVGLWQFAPGQWKTVEHAPLVGDVVIGKFVHQIVERGDVQSSSNVDVRCEVQMRSGNSSSGGVAILEIVPEGTIVDEGDFLVRLDDSTLQNDLTLQQLDTNASQAAVIQAETSVETARLTLQEYESGVFKQELEQLQSLKFVAEENYRRAVEYLKYSERLADKGYVTPIQLEADEFAVDKAKKELDVSNTKIDVLNNFTKQKMLKQLEAALRTAEASLQAQLENHSVETARLEKIKQQIARCIIKAPSAGQVVYANDSTTSRGADEGAPIQEGRLVRERQVIIRLPNPQRMQVVAKVNESRIDLVRPGMSAKVSIDALPGLELEGRVRRVSEYPLQQFSTYTAHIKEYATEIEIISPPEGIRPGMTAQAAVIVSERENATQVPLQAVFERDGRYYCLLHGAAGVEARQVQLGPTNDKYVVVEQGLSGGEDVVVTPRLYADRVTLPTTQNFPSRAVARRNAPAAAEADDVAILEQPKQTVRRKVPTDANGDAPTTAAAGL